MKNGTSERFSPNDVKKYDGEKQCNHRSGCSKIADWEVILIDRHGCNGLVRSCDEHIEEFWGYHPDERVEADGGHLPSDTVDSLLGPRYPEQYLEPESKEEGSDGEE